MIFKYKEFPEANGKKIYRPEIPIILKNGLTYAFLHGVIDSGADCIVLPLDLAEELKVKLQNKTEFYAAGGNFFTVYKSARRVEFILRQDGCENISTKTTVYFAENQQTILLGHRGFLENLKVTLNGPKKEVEIFGK